MNEYGVSWSGVPLKIQEIIRQRMKTKSRKVEDYTNSKINHTLYNEISQWVLEHPTHRYIPHFKNGLERLEAGLDLTPSQAGFWGAAKKKWVRK